MSNIQAFMKDIFTAAVHFSLIVQKVGMSRRQPLNFKKFNSRDNFDLTQISQRNIDYIFTL